MRSKRGYEFGALSYEIIGACIDVQSQLGLHCKEVDYQRALELAFPKRGIRFQREVEIPITFDGVLVTKRRVDFVVWNDTEELILETKARSTILPEDIEQCLLYLHQGGYRLCLLVNFGEKPLGVRRFVHTPAADREKRGTDERRETWSREKRGTDEKRETEGWETDEFNEV